VLYPKVFCAVRKACRRQVIITRGVIDWATLKVEHVESFEYTGPVAQCGMGRPVLTPAYIQSHTVGVPGTKDVIWGPIYDAQAYPSAGATQFTFYALPQGQGTSSAPGAGAVAKTVFDTNIITNNQLSLGNEFYQIGFEMLFFPGVNNSTSTTASFGIEPTTAVGINNFINDIYNVGNGGIVVEAVGTDRKYIQDGPLNLFPPATRLAGFTSVASGSTSTTVVNMTEYAAWSGEPYTLVPIYIQSTQQFTLVLSFAAAIPTPSAVIGRLISRMRGYLIRQAT
jgi:hypothetical protein